MPALSRQAQVCASCKLRAPAAGCAASWCDRCFHLDPDPAALMRAPHDAACQVACTAHAAGLLGSRLRAMDGVAVVATEVDVVRASCALGGQRLVGFPLVLPAPPPPVVRSTCAHMLGVYDARDQYVLQQRVPSGEWATASGCCSYYGCCR